MLSFLSLEHYFYTGFSNITIYTTNQNMHIQGTLMVGNLVWYHGEGKTCGKREPSIVNNSKNLMERKFNGDSSPESLRPLTWTWSQAYFLNSDCVLVCFLAFL